MPPPSDVPLAWLATAWRDIVWTGVDLFFVLSGFLVSGLLFQEHAQQGSVNLGRFYLRRGFKIYPAFYVYTAVVIVTLFATGAAPSWPPVLSELTFVQNYGPMLAFPHTWSLAVEEHFYLLLPLALMGLSRTRRGFAWIPPAMLVLGLLCLSLRLWTAFVAPIFVNHTHGFPTHLRIDSLAFGVTVRYWHARNPLALRRTAATWRWPLLAAYVICLSPVLFASTWFLQTFGYGLLFLGYGALLVAVTGAGIPEMALTRGLAKVGSYSYSIYLWHMVVLGWVMPLIVHWSPIWLGPFWRYAAVAVGLSVTVGAAFSMAIEWPMLSLRDRWFPSLTQRRVAA